MKDTKLNAHKSVAFLYTIINYQKEKLRKQSSYNSIKKNKYLEINLIKEVKDLYIEN